MSHSTSIDRRSLETLREMLTGYRISQIIVVAAKLGIADLLANGPRSIDDLALAATAHARSLYRVLRALAGIGFFRETADGQFELTPLAQELRSDVPGSVHGTAVCYGESCTPDSAKQLLNPSGLNLRERACNSI